MMLKLQAFYTFLARLSKREKIVFYGAAFFVSVMALDRLIISPISSKMKLLDDQIKKKEEAIKNDIRIIAQKDRIASLSNKYASMLSGGSSTEETVTPVLKEIEGLANASSVYLIDVKSTGFKDTGQMREYSIVLNCEAQMEQLVDFMYKIENSDKFLLIERYQIVPKSKESSIARCSMSITKIVVL